MSGDTIIKQLREENERLKEALEGGRAEWAKNEYVRLQARLSELAAHSRQVMHERDVLQARLSAAEERNVLLLEAKNAWFHRAERAEAVVEAAKIFTTRYRYTPESNPLRIAIRHYEEGKK